MEKINVKKFAAAALLGLLALGGGIAAWSVGASPVAAHHGRWNDGWHRRGDCYYGDRYYGDRYYGDRYNRQPGDNAPERPNS